jgi:biotin carboxyl carrier protein
MTLQIDAGGRRHVVEVTRNGDRFVVTINGRTHEVDVNTIKGVSSFLVGTVSYEIAIDGNTIHVDGLPVEVAVVPARAASADLHSALAEGPQQIVAPMPGKITKLLVKPGDAVEARQGLVVVEAMKMENELRARAAGTVAEVRAVEGTTVEAGAILVILE